MPDASALPFQLPDRFEDWFKGRGWAPRPHQLALTETALAGDSALLIAPTGGGKTLAGFLASLIELERKPKSNSGRPALHTLYISPLKALATDVERNLNTPVAEMGLDIRIETRTGDTPQSKRQRQRTNPPDILLTTPEQLALFIASDHADEFFSDLRCVIIDEVHAIAASKRGDLLSLGLATLAEWAPTCRFIGLSATVRDPGLLADWLDVRKAPGPLPPPDLGEVGGGAARGRRHKAQRLPLPPSALRAPPPASGWRQKPKRPTKSLPPPRMWGRWPTAERLWDGGGAASTSSAPKAASARISTFLSRVSASPGPAILAASPSRKSTKP